MSTAFHILHLSDLHFGRIDSSVLEQLETFIRDKRHPIDLTILTGDLTQRARRREFKAAREFLKTLDHPLFIVPGNHDVPLYNIFQRLFSPYRKYLKYLQPYATNYYENDQVAVFGLWTTNYLTVQSGKIRSKDLLEMEQRFANVSSEKIKIIAAHHPLLSMSHPRSKGNFVKLLAQNPHLLMWGHEHHAQARNFSSEKNLPILVASGTSISSRTRIQANSFNYITLDGDSAHVEIFHYDATQRIFQSAETFNFSLKS